MTQSVQKEISKTVRGKCELHPHAFCEVEFLELWGVQKGIYICPQCEADFQDWKTKEEELRKRNENKKRQAEINNALDNAMLATRFRKKTLENYVVENDGQREAVLAVKKFIKDFPDQTGLIMLGNYGTGKNHLACASVIKLIEQGRTGLVITALKAIRRIKDSWKAERLTETEVMRSFLEPDVLVLDEIDVRFQTLTELIYLTEIINDRYEWEKPTILISNMSIPEITESLSERCVDRFRESGRVIVFDWESYRGRK